MLFLLLLHVVNVKECSQVLPDCGSHSHPAQGFVTGTPRQPWSHPFLHLSCPGSLLASSQVQILPSSYSPRRTAFPLNPFPTGYPDKGNNGVRGLLGASHRATGKLLKRRSVCCTAAGHPACLCDPHPGRFSAILPKSATSLATGRW